MNWSNKRVLVTGGAGFIGSHIVDELVLRNAKVTIYDNFATGQDKFIQHHTKDNITIVKGDILETAKLTMAMEGVEIVFHLAANADVKGGQENTLIDLRENILGTHSVLEAAKQQKVGKIVFSSSATVYGEPIQFPTPESNELIQTSLYGASKLAGEAFIQAYSNYFGIQSYIFRFVSWVGERYTHGVVFDFIKKLYENSIELMILGDGSQRKSYLYVKDGVSGIFKGIDTFSGLVNIFNLGHEEYVDVISVARLVCQEMGLQNVKFTFSGGKQGWKGDSPFVFLDTNRIRETGWRANTSIEEGIRRTARYLISNKDLLNRK